MEIPAELISLSRYFGNRSDYVIAGGGNTSYKKDDRMWIKASGVPLSGIDKSGFVCLSRKKLGKIAVSDYSNKPEEREAVVQKDISSAIISGTGRRPSVETALHNLFEYSYIVHTHPYSVNALLCSKQGKKSTEQLFGDAVLFIDYTDPGYTLFKKTESGLSRFVRINGKQPEVVFLQNHGLIVCSENAEKIYSLSEEITGKIKSNFDRELPSSDVLPAETECHEVLAEINEYFRSRDYVSNFKNSELIKFFTADEYAFSRVERPLIPDNIVYCRSNYLFTGGGADSTINDIKSFESEYGYLPAIIAMQNIGLLSTGKDRASAARSMEVFQDMMKVSFLSDSFGGPKFLTNDQVNFIDSWEAENYRRKI